MNDVQQALHRLEFAVLCYGIATAAHVFVVLLMLYMRFFR